MTRKDLIDKVAVNFNIRKKDSEAIVKFIFEEIGRTLSKGERVGIQGFGTFAVTKTNPRRIKLPTGEWIEVPTRKKIFFHPSSKITKGVKA